MRANGYGGVSIAVKHAMLGRGKNRTQRFGAGQGYRCMCKRAAGRSSVIAASTHQGNRLLPLNSNEPRYNAQSGAVFATLVST